MKKQSGKPKTIPEKPKPVLLWLVLVPAVIIIPFLYSFSTDDPVLTIRFLGLSITILIIAVYQFFTRKAESYPSGFIKLPVFIVFVLYLLWTVLSVTWAINPSEGLYDITKTFLSIVFLFFTVQVLIKYNKAFEFLVKTVITVSFVSTTFGIVQYLQNVSGLAGYEQYMALYKVKGLMAHKNQFAISLFPMLPFAFTGMFLLKKWWRAAGTASVLLILLNIVLIQTRSVWLATVVFISISTILWLLTVVKNKQSDKKKLLKQAAVVTGFVVILVFISLLIIEKTGAGNLLKNRIVSVFDSKSRNNQSRFKVWNATLQMIEDHPVKGVGAGNWKIELIPYYTFEYGSFYKNWRRPHNDFLWVTAEKGMVGMILYLMLFLLVLYYGIRVIFSNADKQKQIESLLVFSGITGYLTISMLTFPSERINHQIYLMLMFAFLISEYWSMFKSKTKTDKKVGTLTNFIILFFSSMVLFYAVVLFRSEFYLEKMRQAQAKKQESKAVMYADKAFTPLTTIDAKSLPILIYRGMANMYRGMPDQAYRDFKKALIYFPDNIGVLSNLALVSVQLKKSEEALRYMNRALQLFPHNDDILYNKAYILYTKRQYKKGYTTLLSHGTDKQKEDYKKLMRALKRHID